MTSDFGIYAGIDPVKMYRNSQSARPGSRTSARRRVKAPANRPRTTDIRSRQRKLKDAKVLNIPDLPELVED